MTPHRMYEYIRKSPEPVSTGVIARYFDTTGTTVRNFLKPFLDSGEIKQIKFDRSNCFVTTAEIVGEKVPPRTRTFKPLQHHPSMLGTRQGSNDHLQHKSKHN